MGVYPVSWILARRLYWVFEIACNCVLGGSFFVPVVCFQVEWPLSAATLPLLVCLLLWSVCCCGLWVVLQGEWLLSATPSCTFCLLLSCLFCSLVWFQGEWLLSAATPSSKLCCCGLVLVVLVWWFICVCVCALFLSCSVSVIVSSHTWHVLAFPSYRCQRLGVLWLCSPNSVHPALAP